MLLSAPLSFFSRPDRVAKGGGKTSRTCPRLRRKARASPFLFVVHPSAVRLVTRFAFWRHGLISAIWSASKDCRRGCSSGRRAGGSYLGCVARLPLASRLSFVLGSRPSRLGVYIERGGRAHNGRDPQKVRLLRLGPTRDNAFLRHLACARRKRRGACIEYEPVNGKGEAVRCGRRCNQRWGGVPERNQFGDLPEKCVR